VVLLLAGYTGLSHRQHQKNPDDTTIPTWKQMMEGVKDAVEVNARSQERWVWVDAKATASRLAMGLLLGVSGAGLIGLGMGCFKPFEAFFVPPLSLLAKVPPTAALAVFFVLVGTKTQMYVAMIAFGVLPTLAQAVYLAVKEVSDESLHKARTLGASQPEMIWNIVIPAVLPKLIDSLRLQIGPAMVYLIAAEMVCADVGFGYRIRLQSRLMHMNIVYFYLALLAAFGFLMDSGLKALQKFCCPWYVREGR
jgi:NitT/TauT family transport system permease protein